MSDRVFESPYQWNMYGSDGRSSIGGNFGPIWKNSKGKLLILSKLIMKGLWVDRTSDEFSYTKLYPDFEVKLFQVPLLFDNIKNFVNELENWLIAPKEIHINLTENIKNQALSFYVGSPRENKTLNKTIFELRYSGIYFNSGRWSFGIDQSCIRIFVDELEASLAAIGESS